MCVFCFLFFNTVFVPQYEIYQTVYSEIQLKKINKQAACCRIIHGGCFWCAVLTSLSSPMSVLHCGSNPHIVIITLLSDLLLQDNIWAHSNCDGVWRRERKMSQSDRLCVCSPGSVGGVTGGRSEGLSSTVADLEVVLFPARLFAQHSVGLVQLHKLAVQCWVWRIAVWVQLQ